MIFWCRSHSHSGTTPSSFSFYLLYPPASDHILCFFPSLCQRYIKILPRRKPLATPKDNSQSILPSIKLLKRAENMNADAAITIPSFIVFIMLHLLWHLPRKKMLSLQSMSSYFSIPSKPLQKTGSRQLK